MKGQFQPHLDKYKKDGLAIFRNVLDSAIIEESKEHIQWLLGKNPELRPELLNTQLMSEDPFWVRLISDDRLLDIAEAFIGEDIALFASHYIAKPPHNGQPVLWHQDGSYWPLEPMEVITLWVALDDADPENGCMRIIPGTQNQRLLSMDEMDSIPEGNVLGSGIQPDQIDEAGAVDVILKAGDVSIHHPNVIHGSDANLSDRWRRGLTIRYIPASTKILSEEQWPSAFMLRGKPSSGVNSYLPWPKYDESKMFFSNWKDWNQKCGKMNELYSTQINTLLGKS